MADHVDLKVVVKHLVDGTFNENLCRVCLVPLGEICENIFTRICKEDQEYCIADVLQQVCQMEISDVDNFSVCSDCIVMAAMSYKFYIMCKRSDEILNFYIEELQINVDLIETKPKDLSNDTLCITLPEYIPSVQNFDCEIQTCLQSEYVVEHETSKRSLKKQKTQEKIVMSSDKPLSDDELVVVIEESGHRTFYKVADDGTLELVEKKTKAITRPERKKPLNNISNQSKLCKLRKKRDPMEFIKCSLCPVKYRFMSKLKKHMKTDHDLDLFVCKICKAVTEDKQEFELHLASHTGIHRCDYCNTIFKKRSTIIAHLKWHEDKNITDMDSAHVCEICGFILLDEDELKDHYDKKHDKKFTCFYCGKMYKGELSCEAHIRKHEMHGKKDVKREKPEPEPTPEPRGGSAGRGKRSMCATCGKHFVDERSLMWHSMLHTNERPYTCDVCGRGFISLNRRNQHAVCAHTKPTKQCPICPALFHLRSMVNSHIKKVHLKEHKRRNRSSKHQNMNVHWRTERVPIQLLGVDIQSHIIELTQHQPPAL